MGADFLGLIFALSIWSDAIQEHQGGSGLCVWVKPWWQSHTVPATQEAETGGSLEPRSSEPTKRTEQDPVPLKKKERKKTMGLHHSSSPACYPLSAMEHIQLSE
jgi:hypothetical protein